MTASYTFVSRWAVPASPERCWDALERSLRAGSLAWWPAVRARAAPRRPAVGDRIGLDVRSPLGYRLTVDLELTEVVAGSTLAAVSTGDLSGRGRLEMSPVLDRAVLVWTWKVDVQRPWMRALSPVLRPAFATAHRAVMRRGERGFVAFVGRDA